MYQKGFLRNRKKGLRKFSRDKRNKQRNGIKKFYIRLSTRRLFKYLNRRDKYLKEENKNLMDTE